MRATVTVTVLSGRLSNGRIPPAPRAKVRAKRSKDATPSVLGYRLQEYRGDVSASTRDHWFARQSKGRVR